MSALFGSKTKDMCSAQARVRFVPIADIARSAKAKEAANRAANKKKARVGGTGLSQDHAACVTGA